MTWADTCDVTAALNVSPERAEKVRALQPLVEKSAAEAALPVDLVNGVVWVESRFNRTARSNVGAQGYIQIMPRTFDWLRSKFGGGSDPFDPATNLRLGSLFLALLRDRYQGREEWQLAAYNAGPGNVAKMGPGPFLGYVHAVQRARDNFEAARARCQGADVAAPSWGSASSKLPKKSRPRPQAPTPAPAPAVAGAGGGLALVVVAALLASGKGDAWLGL